jgi:hypothetical protein
MGTAPQINLFPYSPMIKYLVIFSGMLLLSACGGLDQGQRQLYSDEISRLQALANEQSPEDKEAKAQAKLREVESQFDCSSPEIALSCLDLKQTILAGARESTEFSLRLTKKIECLKQYRDINEPFIKASNACEE